ncbi:helix-turn-helix domain-containing protein [Modestobacter sp. I12A-02662]|uniref:helix-turn-helix domain-containing protein n=1 Tax=Modestobacter sp. I12A-02662 TaxID=1730496 RepID=UPI0034E00023
MRHSPSGEHTVHPPSDPREAALLRALAAELAGDGAPTAADPGGALPGPLREVLGLAAAALAAGRPVTLACHEPTLSTQEAADLLGISRPTLVRLLDAGVIPYDRPGRHRRVQLADLLVHQQRCHHAERGGEAVTDRPG